MWSRIRFAALPLALWLGASLAGVALAQPGGERAGPGKPGPAARDEGHHHGSGDQAREARPHHGPGDQVRGHRFQCPRRWSKVFDDPQRDKWQRPRAVVQLLSLRPDARVADIGAGTGYFAVWLARAAPRGVVWAIDVEPKMVQHMQRRAAREKLPNLRARLGQPDDPKIPEPVDLVFLANTYHHIHQREAYFRRLRDKLRPGGRLAIVDYKMGKLPVGPPPGHRISAARVHQELTAAGYERARLDRDTLPYQFIAIYRPAQRR